MDARRMTTPLPYRTADTRYAYATGRIRAMEAHLLDTKRLERYFDAGTVATFARLLAEDGYPAAADPARSLELAWQSACRLVRSLVVDARVVDVILAANDFHNLKVILKAFAVYWPRNTAGTAGTGGTTETGGTTGTAGMTSSVAADAVPRGRGPVVFEQLQPLLQQPALVDPSRLFGAISGQKLRDIPIYLAQAAAAAAAGYQQTYDIAEIDIVLDQRLAKWQAGLAAAIGVPYLSEYLGRRTDLVNLGLLLRTRKLRSGGDYLRHILLPGGSLAADQLVACYGEPVQQITILLRHTWLAPLAAATEQADGGAAIGRFSQAADNLLLRFIRQSRFVLRGPEILIGYLVRSEMEIKSLRIILVCLRNGLPAGEARELARSAYG
jgi:V/A-type H+/Na+-transporting ATPase subunit C